MLTQVTAQGDFKIPVVLSHREIPSDRPITANEGFVGVKEAEQKVDIKLYPNPATDVLHISSGNANLKSGIIFNAVGQEVISVSIKNREGQVDIRRLKPGIYFVRIELESGYVFVKKFVKGSL